MKCLPSMILLMSAALVSPSALRAAPDVVSGKYYRFQVVGRSGLGPVNDVLFQGPSINDGGAVAFAGKASATANAVFVTDPGISPPRMIRQQPNQFSFLGGIQINNSMHLLALESPMANPDGTRQYFLRDWNASPPGPTYGDVPVAGTASTQPDFKQIFFPATLNDALPQHQVSFSAIKTVVGVPTTDFNRLVVGYRPGFAGQANIASPPGNPLRPMIANNGQVVVRAGPAVGSCAVGGVPPDPIRLYAADLAMSEDIATSTDFCSLGQSPGISPSGEIVVFYGVLRAAAFQTNAGAGIFASVLHNGSRKIIRVAGRRVEKQYDKDPDPPKQYLGNEDGVCDPGEPCEKGELGVALGNAPLDFDTFDADSRVGVTHLQFLPAGPANDTFVVSFIGTPNAPSSPPRIFTANKGLWTIRVDLNAVGASCSNARGRRCR